MLKKAYSVLTEKSFTQDGEFVYIEGIASTPQADKMGDIVEPMGAQFKTPMPLLLQHSHEKPVGHVTFAKPTLKGIPFRAQIPVVTEPGEVRDRTEGAIHSLKYGLISAVSIGFQAVDGEVERLKSGGVRFKQWIWHELSLVTVPANSDAVITAVKSLDTSAAGGKKDVSGVQLSGGSGNISAHAGAVQLIPRK